MSKQTEAALSFYVRKEPISTIWREGDTETNGTLLWQNDIPVLQLMIAEDTGAIIGEEGSPTILQKTKPPLQPTIYGQHPDYGTITLENCCQVYRKHGSSNSEQRRYVLLHLQPTQIWIGSPKNEVSEISTCLNLFDARLAGFFGTPFLDQKMLWGDEYRTIKEALGNPVSVWTYHDDSKAVFDVPILGIKVYVGSTMEEGFSSTQGYSAHSYLSISLTSDTPIPIEKFQLAKRKLEQIFSIFSLESFTFQAEIYSNMMSSTALAWYLGRNIQIFSPPMHHEILVDFRHPGLFQRIYNDWLVEENELEISRWLFCKALKETDDGLARFITVAQALEVLGRIKGPPSSTSKSEFQNALRAIESALEPFDKSFLKRIIGLVSSSNKASFKATLEHMITDAMTALQEPKDAEKIDKFAKQINDTRNALVHMSTSNGSKLEEAFRRCNKLSLLICFWYAAIQAHHLGLVIPSYKVFLLNNRNARHGLPNNIIEHNHSSDFSPLHVF